MWTVGELEALRARTAEILLLLELEFVGQTSELLAQQQRVYAAEHNLGLDAGYDPTYDPEQDPHRDTGRSPDDESYQGTGVWVE